VYCTKAMSTGMTFGGLIGSAIILGQNAGCSPYVTALALLLVNPLPRALVTALVLPLIPVCARAGAFVATIIRLITMPWH
jgi:hypothetical protein